MSKFRMRVSGRIAFLVLALFGGACRASAGKNETELFKVAQRRFESGGEKILVDVYTPIAAGRHPPILVLHGAGGMLFDGPEMSRAARELAAAGNEAYQVHYFNRTHTWFARQAVLLKLFPTWLSTVHDAVEWVRSIRPEAPSIGVFGYSLGAFAAIEESRRNPAIGAVAEQAGGFWHGHPEGPTRQPLPSMLLIHGFDDERVPFEKYTKPLIAYLRAHHVSFETRFYSGESHQFSAGASMKVRQQAVDFFARHLSKQQMRR
jgi:dienelactone hydrolase